MIFDKLGTWPVGYFQHFSQWLLSNRKSLGPRVNAINAELERIGFIKVFYRPVMAEGSVRMTEERIGFSVSEGSSLEKLIQAYVFQGGNPFDISPFMIPDTTEILNKDENGNVTILESYPYGGLVAPKTVDYNSLAEGSGFGDTQGGFLQFARYYPGRLGSRTNPSDLDTVKVMKAVRDWSLQDITERFHMIEWKVLKLMDLREQLMQERDDLLLQAFGGQVSDFPLLDESLINPQLRVLDVINDFYSVLYDSPYPYFKAKAEVGYLSFTFPDDVSELTHPLGG